MKRDVLGPRREPRRPILRWQGQGGRTEECALSNARPTTIGREASNTIALDSRLVSKAHALVEFRDGEYTIQDLESANGTKVNGEPTSIRVLEPGDRIEIGDVELNFLDLARTRAVGIVVAAPAAGRRWCGWRLTGGVTMALMLGIDVRVDRRTRSGTVRKVDAGDSWPRRRRNCSRSSRPAAEARPPVKDVLQVIGPSGVAPGAGAATRRGGCGSKRGRWRDAALLLAAAAARDPKNSDAQAAFEQAVAQLDRAASKALASAELATSACATTTRCCMPTRCCSWSTARIPVMNAPPRSPTRRASKPAPR